MTLDSGLSWTAFATVVSFLRLTIPASMMVTELYDALRAAGAPEEKARAAAQAMSEESLATKADVARLERELLVVKWMTGGIVAGVISLLLKSFSG